MSVRFRVEEFVTMNDQVVQKSRKMGILAVHKFLTYYYSPHIILQLRIGEEREPRNRRHFCVDCLYDRQFY